jgi:hypothetical protein
VREPPITRWDHPDLSAEVAGIRGEVNGPPFDAILDVNRDPSGPAVRPARVTLAEEQWRRPEALEFFVDFETQSRPGWRRSPCEFPTTYVPCESTELRLSVWSGCEARPSPGRSETSPSHSRPPRKVAERVLGRR